MGQGIGSTGRGELRGKVGIVASSAGALREVACLLSRQSVAVVRTIAPGSGGGGSRVGACLDGLRALQSDDEVEVVVALVAEARDVDVDRVLGQVRDSNCPMVVCLLGGDVSSAWQAGAIPARRLDEAALRAAAWVRGWDQALVTSQLEEQDEELGAMAAGLRRLLGKGRRGIVGLFASASLCREAGVMLADVAGEEVALDCVELSPERMRDALEDPQAAVIILDVALQGNTPGALVDEVSVALENLDGPGPLVVVHVCGPDPAEVDRAEARLSRAGATIVGSNAAAARLAGLVVSG